MRIGLFGFPLTGKSTLFRLLTGLDEPAHHAARGEAQIGVTKVPDARLVRLAEMYSPQEAITPGFLDRVVSPDQLLSTARETAAALAKLDMPAHAATKLRVRGAALEALRQAITSEFG